MRRTTIGATALLCLVAFAHDAAPAGQTAPLPVAVPALDLLVGPSTRLLVVSPHPDDGMLGVGGLMRRVVTHGGQVHVVLMTSGDGFPAGVETADGVARPTPEDYRRYGGRREIEARSAVASLGMNRTATSFLGFPDEGMCELASTYLSAKASAFKSPYTQRSEPPRAERIIRGVTYRGTDVRRELERLLRTFRPTIVAVPHPHDAHPDHCSTHIFMHEALDALASQRRPPPRVLHYLIHYRQWPLSDDAGNGSELQPPAGFAPSEGRLVSLALTPDEIEAKEHALRFYRSQMLVIGRFMLGFARSNELYIEGEPASLPACWCNGDNIVPAR